MQITDFQPKFLTLAVEGPVVVAAVTSDRLSDEENIELFGRELFALVEKYDCTKVVLDLSQVHYVTSSALGKLITLHRKLHRKGGKLCLCGAGGDVDKVLRTSRLSEYFRTAANVQEAQTAVA